MRPPARSNRTANYTRPSPLNALAKVVMKKSKKTRIAHSLTKNQKAEVQKLVKGVAETKYVAEALSIPDASANLGTYTAFSSGITGVAEIYGCLPRVGQGVDSQQRIGDSISPTRCTVHLDIVATSAVNFPSDKTVHVFLLTAKSIKTLPQYGNIPIKKLLDLGNGTEGEFDGTSFRAMCPVNTKDFTVLKHKKFRMVKTFGMPNSATAAVTAGTTDGVISPSHQYAHLTMKVKVPKKLKYEVSGSLHPTNYAPFLVIGFTSNAPVDAASTVVDLQVLGRVEMRFKDE